MSLEVRSFLHFDHFLPFWHSQKERHTGPSCASLVSKLKTQRSRKKPLNSVTVHYGISPLLNTAIYVKGRLLYTAHVSKGEKKDGIYTVYIEIGERRNGQNDIANAAALLFLCTISRMRIRYHWTYYTAHLKGQSIQLTLVSRNLGPCLSAAGKNEIWILVQNNKPKHL